MKERKNASADGRRESWILKAITGFVAFTAMGSVPVVGAFATGAASGFISRRPRKWLQFGFGVALIVLTLLIAAFLVVGLEAGIYLGGIVEGNLGAILCGVLGLMVGGIVGCAVLGNIFLFALGGLVGGSIKAKK